MKFILRGKVYIVLIMMLTLLAITGCGEPAKISDVKWKEKHISKKENPKDKIETDKEEHIKQEIEKMNLEEKVGQMFIVGFDGYEHNETIERFIRERHIGGVILFTKNIDSVEQTKNLIRSLQEINKENELKLFVSLDEEGGIVSRIPKELQGFEGALEVGNRGDLDYAYDHGRNIGKTIRELGFNLNFAPVLDVNSNPQNPVIGKRAFGSDPEIVKNMAVEVYKGMEKENIIAVGKHFPGHGDTSVDSHMATPIINKSTEELENLELIPFKGAIKEGIPAIMVSHLSLPQIDEDIASTSYKIVTNILREDLGFKGLVVTDDMVMEGLKSKYEVKDGVVKAIQAGVDIVVISTGAQDQEEAIEEVVKAVENGYISEERINESTYRIIKAKKSI